uniref:Non-specific serine/threonine protein kinase n=1 Tax=Mycena chlorophos TaxID=658473 RepID=A0ABQ0LH81_MYCCL|nr:predicted protein [Mycena chlorophos]
MDHSLAATVRATPVNTLQEPREWITTSFIYFTNFNTFSLHHISTNPDVDLYPTLGRLVPSWNMSSSVIYALLLVSDRFLEALGGRETWMSAFIDRALGQYCIPRRSFQTTLGNIRKELKMKLRRRSISGINAWVLVVPSSGHAALLPPRLDMGIVSKMRPSDAAMEGPLYLLEQAQLTGFYNQEQYPDIPVREGLPPDFYSTAFFPARCGMMWAKFGYEKDLDVFLTKKFPNRRDRQVAMNEAYAVAVAARPYKESEVDVTEVRRATYALFHKCRPRKKRTSLVRSSDFDTHDAELDGGMCRDVPRASGPSVPVQTQADEDKHLGKGNEVLQAAQGAQKVLAEEVSKYPELHPEATSSPMVLTTLRLHQYTVSFLVAIDEPGIEGNLWVYEPVVSFDLRPSATSVKQDSLHAKRMLCFFHFLDELNAAIAAQLAFDPEKKISKWTLCRRVMYTDDYNLKYDRRVNTHDPRVFLAYLDSRIPAKDRTQFPDDEEPQSSDENLVDSNIEHVDLSTDIDGSALPFDNQLVVCKILTSEYGIDVHKALWKADLAPRLLVHRKAISPYGCQFPFDFGFHMAIMEYVPADKHAPLPEVRKALLTRLKDFLAANGLVHGDLREANILFHTNAAGEVKLRVVDFDWAGRDGEVFYPQNMVDKDKERHKEAKPGKAIRRSHDAYMLQKQIESCDAAAVLGNIKMDVDNTWLEYV